MPLRCLLRRSLLPLVLTLTGPIWSLPAQAQLRPNPPAFPRLAQLGDLNPTSPGALRVGCPYQTNTAQERNTGFLDSNASYAIAQIPLSLPDGASIRIEGSYAQVRYFSLQSYDGARAGNYIDALADGRLIALDGATSGANIAALPQDGRYGGRYTVRLRYEAPPARPEDRAPNTLYVGAPSNRISPTRVAKQVVYRIYLPNPDTDFLGITPLPRIIYSGPDRGEVDFDNTPDQAQCERIRTASTTTRTINPAVFPGRNIQFVPISQTQDSVLYPNGDANYLRAASSLTHGQVVVIRSRRMKTPLLPPAITGAEETRYWSLCHYELGSSAVVHCLADREIVTQDDGFDLFVISPAANRPSRATAAYKVNWLEWGPTRSELIVLRQLLSRPDFEGNYALAVANPDAPVSQTLGRYAPEVSYCDAATFDAVAGSGSAAILAACQAR